MTKRAEHTGEGEPIIGRNVERDWRGQPWSNATHLGHDPDALH